MSAEGTTLRADLGTVNAKVEGSERISIASFPADLQPELIKLDLDRDGCLDAKEIEVAMRVLINERKGRISIKAFDPRLESELKDLGADEDGYLGFRQIEEALLSLLENKKRVRQMKMALFFLLGVGAIFLAAVFGLVYAVVDMTKDMRSMNGVLVDRVTNKPLATGSSIYAMDDQGALMPREPPKSSSRRSRRDDEKWAPGDGTAVKTSVLTINYELDSSWYSGQVSSLKAIMTSKYGGFMSTNINGFVILKSQTAGKAPLIVFDTALGRMVLNGTELSQADGQLKSVNLLELYKSLPEQAPAGTRRSAPMCVDTDYPSPATCCGCTNYDQCISPYSNRLCECQAPCGF